MERRYRAGRISRIQGAVRNQPFIYEGTILGRKLS